jgi:hypothetical protein
MENVLLDRIARMMPFSFLRVLRRDIATFSFRTFPLCDRLIFEIRKISLG